jgi:hypothetical protein
MMRLLKSPPIPIRILLCIDALLLSAFVVVGAMVAIGAVDRQSELLRQVNLEWERNLPTWYSTIQLFLLAVMLGLHAWRIRERPISGLVWLPAVVFLTFSIDETAQFHEWIGYQLDYLLPGGTREDTLVSYTGLWGIAVGVPTLVLLLAMWNRLRPYFGGSAGTNRRFIIGTCLLIVGAAGLDFVANFVASSSNYVQALQVLVEEGSEMLGVTILCWAAWDLLSAGGFQVAFDPVSGFELDKPHHR